MQWMADFVDNARAFIDAVTSVLPPGMGIALGVVIVSLVALGIKRIFF